MKNIFIMALMATLFLGASCGKDPIQPPTPPVDTKPVFSSVTVTDEVVWYNTYTTIIWEGKNLTSVTVNGEPATSPYKTPNLKSPENTFVLIGYGSHGETITVTKTVKARAEDVTLLCNTPKGYTVADSSAITDNQGNKISGWKTFGIDTRIFSFLPNGETWVVDGTLTSQFPNWAFLPEGKKIKSFNVEWDYVLDDKKMVLTRFYSEDKMLVKRTFTRIQ